MSRIYSRSSATAVLLLLLSGFAVYAARPPVEQATILLPLEVIGPNGYTAAVRFDLDDAPEIDALYLKAHRLAYRDASTNPRRGAKGSVQLNDGPWIDLDNSTVNCYEHEAAYGCLSGAYHTVRLTVPVEGAKSGQNTLRFRFNGTDNFSSGYRILEFNLLRGSQKLLSKDRFTQDRPTDWQPPLSNASDIAAGKVWWEEALLKDYPDGPTIRATCAGCHAQDGRDLEYFAFSNWSIQERSKFHGLDQKQAEQIASYIRSLKNSKGIERRGRPWNPPYQPGPGLDSKPVAAWSAGAGLDWVLEKDADMLPYLFPEGTSKKAIAQVTDNQSTLNVREMPIALQMPDWQAWLPEVHPVDIWGKAFQNTDPYITYRAVRDKLAGGTALVLRSDPAAIEAKELITTLESLQKSMASFVRLGGPQPCRNEAVHSSEGFALLGKPAAPPSRDKWTDPEVCERPMRAINHWNAIKHWEVMQEFALEEASADLYPYGEPRGWAGARRQVFELAPHRIGNDSYKFAHLDRAQGSYFNTAWYQLQVTLNAGNRNPQNHRPPDWKYQMNHLYHASDDNRHPQPLRYVQTLIKMQQNLDMRRPNGFDEPAEHFPYQEDRGPTSNGWWLTHVTPWRFVSVGGSFFGNDSQRFGIWDELEAVQPGLKSKVQNALLAHWLEKTETYAPEDWPRGEGQNNVPPANAVPTPYSGSGLISSSENHHDGIYRTIPLMRQAGIREALVERLRQWGKTMWPAGDWDALRSASPETISITLQAEDYDSAAIQSDQAAKAWSAFTTFRGYQAKGYVTAPTQPGFGKSQGFEQGARLDYTFELPQEGTYHLWVRRYARSIGTNSAYFGLDGVELSSVDNGEEDFHRWVWVKVASQELEAGPHSLQLVRREVGYLTDAFLLTTGDEDPNQSEGARRLPAPVADNPNEGAIRMYPNPVSGGSKLQVTVDGQEPADYVLVYNIQGRELIRAEVDQRQRVALEIGTLPRGLYLVKAYFSEHTYVEKLLVE